MAALELDSVSKVFDDDGEDIVAVDDVSLTVADGEFLVLVGPSGCGKSTTLRMIAGLESVSSGAISLDDDRVDGVPPRDRDIAMVFQSYALYPHMSVRENMRFGLEESTDLATAEMDDRVEETAAMLGIADLLDRRPGELSGGQQQRVALGRAIVREPSAFLMDEPLSNLDAKLRAQMRTELQELQNRLDTTTVYVTHDQTEAMTMGDRIAVLDDGRLQQVGTPLECYHRPNNRFVAGFIGEPSMNFLEADVVREGGAVALEFADGLRYPLEGDAADAVGGASRVTLGIRPEDVAVDPSAAPAEADDPHTYAGTVDVVEPTGDENVLHLTVGGTDLTATVGGLRQVDEGASVAVRIPPAAIHLFGADGTALHNRSLAEASVTAPERGR